MEKIVKALDDCRLVLYPERNMNRYVFQEVVYKDGKPTWIEVIDKNKRDQIRKKLGEM